MADRIVTLRSSEDKVQALDRIAEQQHLDRNILLNEALDQYLSLHEHHRSLIEEGLRQAEAGQLVDHEDVMDQVRSRFNKKMTA